MKTPSFLRGENRERTFYYLITFLLFAAYFSVSFIMSYMGKPGAKTQNLLFGFSQIRFLLANLPLLSLLKLAVIAASVYAVFHLSQRYAPISNGQIPFLLRAALSVLAVDIFFTLRNYFINSDGMSFTAKFAEAVPTTLGAYVTHDEILEFYVHSRFWFYANHYFGWSVNLSYQVLSSLAGGVFVFLLLTYSPRISARKPLYAFLLCISGGFMQLFFGDVENYTLVSAWMMGYFLAAALFLEKKISVVIPAALLAIAMMFHLLAGFLIPSMLYLFFVAWQRNEKRAVIYAAGIFAFIIALTLLIFHLKGLPISDLWYKSNATGRGGKFSMLPPFSFDYYADIANLIFLLLPAWILILPLLFYKRLMLDEHNYHLLIASFFMGGFVLLWHAYLGVYQDWNLFAPAALPAALLIWRSILRIESLQSKFSPAAMFGALAFLHSYSWILGNHYVK